MRDVIAGAPSLHDHLDDGSRAHFERLNEYLRHSGVSCTVNPRLVRGLDYYTRTVFEWTTDKLGAQSAVCAGGRYDGLVEQLGGKPTPAAGFAIGMERLVELLALQNDPHRADRPHGYLVLLGEEPEKQGLKLAESLRNAGLRIECNCGGGGLKAQLKRADRSGASHALLLGEEEVKTASVTLKDLRTGAQRTMPQSELADQLLKETSRG
jgi:histidyl-tRNA synthetase